MTYAEDPDGLFGALDELMKLTEEELQSAEAADTPLTPGGLETCLSTLSNAREIVDIIRAHMEHQS